MTGIAAARAAAARHVERLCRGWPEPGELLQKVGNLVATAVPHDTRDWQLYDPQAMVPVAAVCDHPVPFGIRLAHCEIEQSGGEPDEISDHLMITTDTVHDHLKAVYRKTGTNGRGPLRHRLALDTWAQVHSDDLGFR